MVDTVDTASDTSSRDAPARRRHLPIVEVTGPRGSGKSVASAALGSALRTSGLCVIRGDRLGWGRMPGAAWVREPLGNVVQECLLASTILPSSDLAPLRAGLEAIRRCDESVSTKFRAARGLWRQIGLRLRADRPAGSGQVILFDEGLVHTAHYIFVQARTAPDDRALEAFCRLLRLPDVLVMVRAPRDELVDRLVARPHPPRRGMTRAGIETYVDRATEVFDRIESLSFMRHRLIRVCGMDPPGEIAAQVIARLRGESAPEPYELDTNAAGSQPLREVVNLHG